MGREEVGKENGWEQKREANEREVEKWRVRKRKEGSDANSRRKEIIHVFKKL